jgi:hypothetical protein
MAWEQRVDPRDLYERWGALREFFAPVVFDPSWSADASPQSFGLVTGVLSVLEL